MMKTLVQKASEQRRLQSTTG